jgi:multidrug efflux system membrane fusion protein
MVALNNINETGNRRSAGERLRGGRRSQAKLWVAVGIAIAVVATAWLAYSYRHSDAAASAPAALPQVVVSKPLEREVSSSLGFLGQFSAVEQVELRAQVGGTLTGIHSIWYCATLTICLVIGKANADRQERDLLAL